MTARDRIEAEHAEATHGPRHDDDRPSWREAREDMRARRGDPVMTTAEVAELRAEGIERGWWT